jgi:hypothetical protein
LILARCKNPIVTICENLFANNYTSPRSWTREKDVWRPDIFSGLSEKVGLDKTAAHIAQRIGSLPDAELAKALARFVLPGIADSGAAVLVSAESQKEASQDQASAVAHHGESSNLSSRNS